MFDSTIGSRVLLNYRLCLLVRLIQHLLMHFQCLQHIPYLPDAHPSPTYRVDVYCNFVQIIHVGQRNVKILILRGFCDSMKQYQ